MTHPTTGAGGNTAWRTTLGTMSALMAAGCGMFFVFALHDWIVGDGKTGAGVLAGLTFFFGMLTAMCGFSAYRAFFMPATGEASTARDNVDVEQHILALAATNEGCVTVAELALHAAIPLDKAEAALDAMTARSRADIETTASGETVYRVRGLLSADEKRSARDPLSS